MVELPMGPRPNARDRLARKNYPWWKAFDEITSDTIHDNRNGVSYRGGYVFFLRDLLPHNTSGPAVYNTVQQWWFLEGREVFHPGEVPGVESLPDYPWFKAPQDKMIWMIHAWENPLP